ncbi:MULTISPECIES: bifunctional diguanylate cyclase/phosphodiesterase [Acidiphilium]|uniref:putative bifunctional diguanylate cyclase/phosphodiesterase n=1 Tax=Acidiphilium TaxID=522 RepID=UPI000BD305FA|nr:MULTISPECIES: EAL domain-containing protein [Acidiphilium]OZB31078.1 MAG: GGDEF-domain containing protein [Acidiphilium sp. 34-64-41]HQT83387.1 EAL domain-containing protein [Acidiphilium rubrum]
MSSKIFSLDVVPSELRLLISRENFGVRIRLTRGACILGATVATAIELEFNNKIHLQYAGYYFIALILNYFILFLFTTIWVNKNTSDNSFIKLKYIFNLFIFTLGSFWSFYLVSIIQISPAAQQSLILSIMIGLISTTISSGPLSSTLMFWLPLTIGLFCAIYVSGHLDSVAFVVSISCYTSLVFFTMVFLNRKMLERSVNEINLAQTGETIRILLRDFEENASDWLWETDTKGEIKHVSPRFAEVARQPQSAIRGDLLAFMAGTDQTLQQVRPAEGDVFEPLRRRMITRKPFRDMVMPVNMGGERRWWSMTGKPIEDSSGRFIGYRGVGSDVTAVHRSRERIAYLARHDSLTDLANRTEFNSALSLLLSEGAEPNVALLCLDLDQFKAVNDSYGHGLGDSVLRAVAHRIRGAIRDRDVAARLGGDEFSILLPADDEFEATAIADRVIDRVSRPYKFDGVTVEIGVSIGIALAPRDGRTPEVLYRNADLALYRAKDAGRGTWRLFDPTMDRQLQDRRGLQRDIKSALRDDQLFVEFQPVVALSTRSIVGLEALVRWKHPDRGIIPPGEFIEIAERTGLIGAITAFVLAESAALAAQLPGFMAIAVNLSPLHLREAWLVDQVSEIIQQAGVAPDRIEFEVTETAVLETEGRTIDNLHRLRALGCRIAIDDFGTGYSSLATLSRFPFDRLKIDRSFINDLEHNAADAPIVKAIIDLSQTMGLRVTAEGVETERQAAILTLYQCNEIQGFLYSPPVLKAQVLQLFESGRTVTGLGIGCVEPEPIVRQAMRSRRAEQPMPQHSSLE